MKHCQSKRVSTIATTKSEYVLQSGIVNNSACRLCSLGFGQLGQPSGVFRLATLPRHHGRIPSARVLTLLATPPPTNSSPRRSAPVPKLAVAQDRYFLDDDEWSPLLAQRFLANNAITTNEWFKKLIALWRRWMRSWERVNAAERKQAAERDAADQEIAAAEIRAATVEVSIALLGLDVGKQEVELANLNVETAEVTAQFRLARLKLLSEQASTRRSGPDGTAVACLTTTATAAPATNSTRVSGALRK
ncbi:hypothetical protein FN846DRAFT_887111 [Sphaerosporella brunnea]|uniref:Uncharacterized protein n=1 Tax=Sphaerosporella brunnea TaxID=1250544 RepID=A0A5J5F734_9PEZI|nr:hypothetical protein FN846DRAFT_887111 [Sphaerosporella brunnea]